MDALAGKSSPIGWRAALVISVSEFMREAAVLLAVFVPLDLALVGGLTARAVLATVVGLALLLAVGVGISIYDRRQARKSQRR